MIAGSFRYITVAWMNISLLLPTQTERRNKTAAKGMSVGPWSKQKRAASLSQKQNLWFQSFDVIV